MSPSGPKKSRRMLLSTPWTSQPRWSKKVTASEPMSPLLPVTRTRFIGGLRGPCRATGALRSPWRAQLAVAPGRSGRPGRPRAPGDQLRAARPPRRRAARSRAGAAPARCRPCSGGRRRGRNCPVISAGGPPGRPGGASVRGRRRRWPRHPAADVDHLRRPPAADSRAAGSRCHHVVHGDEVARLAAVLVDDRALAGEQAAQEDREDPGVGVAERLPGPVDVEQPQADDRETVAPRPG